jgi:signal transduction histidine kinase
MKMCITVEVYGRLAREEQEALSESLKQEFANHPDCAGEAEPVFLTFVNDFAQGSDDEPRRSCDARVCILTEKTERGKHARFFQTLMNRSPLVPVVIQVREDGDWSRLPHKVRRAIDTSWWSIVRPIGLPVMVVDRAQRIIKANHAALGLFGPVLAGRPYRAAVEGKENEACLPDGHPIRDALGPDDGGAPPRGISRYRDVIFAHGEVYRRALLVCFPLVNELDPRVTSVVVFYIDLIRFDRINEAVRAFAVAKGIKALQEAIVEQIGKMGYRRARLYEYDRAGQKLLGRTSIGFRDTAKAVAFQSRERELNNDPKSYDTIIKRYPSLFIYNDAAQKDPESDLVHHCERGDDSEDLEKALVNRWVDAPLLIPEVDVLDKRSVRPWGKISIDDAEDSDRLSPRDVADLAALAAVAGGAMGEKLRARRDNLRARRDNKLLDTYEEDTRRLDSQELRELDVPVMSGIKKWLLELFCKLFGLDLAIYRAFRPEDRTLVFETGVATWDGSAKMVTPTTGCPVVGSEILKEARVSEVPSFDMFDTTNVDDEGSLRVGANVRYFCHDRADAEIREVLRVKRELSVKERRYLNWIQSEIGIPIVVRNKVRGVLVGLSGRPNAFPPDRDIVLRRFTNVAHLWFQLGELRDARTSAINLLGNALKAWSLLQDVDDQKLYAGLAAILTAGCGLGWHRAMIFRNLDHSMTAAELVYAVGGMGETFHGEAQSEWEKAEPDLEALVRKRIEDPIPHGFDPKLGQDRVDSLYKTYVARYVDDPAHRPRVSYAGGGSRLREILELQAKGWGRVQFLKLDRDDELIRSVDARHPGLFAARTTSTYFFPLYSNEPEHPGPLGFIALDNAYRPNPLEDTVLALTMAIVQLFRDTVAARRRYRLFNTMLVAFPLMGHEPAVVGELSSFRLALNKLLNNLENPSAPDHDVPGLIAKVRRSFDALEAPIKKLGAAQELIRDSRGPGRDVTQGADLKAHLLEVIRDWEETRAACFRVKAIELEDGFSVPCDRVVLDNAIRCLLENAQSVSARDNQGRFLVELRATTRNDVPRFKRMVTIEVTDHGPGVSAEKQPFLFIHGFTDRHDLPEWGRPEQPRVDHYGLGLGMARASLLQAHGELRLQDPGGDGKGATFAIHLGLDPRPSPRASEGTGS